MELGLLTGCEGLINMCQQELADHVSVLGIVREGGRVQGRGQHVQGRPLAGAGQETYALLQAVVPLLQLALRGGWGRRGKR